MERASITTDWALLSPSPAPPDRAELALVGQSHQYLLDVWPPGQYQLGIACNGCVEELLQGAKFLHGELRHASLSFACCSVVGYSSRVNI